MQTSYEVKAYIVGLRKNPDDELLYHVMIEHPDGEQEISYQYWSSKTEAETALEQYAKDRGAEISRTH